MPLNGLSPSGARPEPEMTRGMRIADFWPRNPMKKSSPSALGIPAASRNGFISLALLATLLNTALAAGVPSAAGCIKQRLNPHAESYAEQFQIYQEDTFRSLELMRNRETGLI